MGDDLTRWQYWWEWNKDPFLRVKEAVQASTVVRGSDDDWLSGRAGRGRDMLRPTKSEVANKVYPALVHAIETSEQREIISGCLIALAKIGRSHVGLDVLSLIRPRLKSHDQEIRETAALSLGIAQARSSADDLIAIMQDTPRGRELCDRSEVDERTRSFAAYGLGLLASRGDVALQRKLLEPLAGMLAGDDVRRDLRVAVVNALRLFGVPGEDSRARALLRGDAARALWEYFDGESRPGLQVIRAHALPAIAQLVGRGNDTKGVHKKRIAVLLADTRRFDPAVTQAAAIALGILCKPEEQLPEDREFVLALRRTFETSLDHQTRYFCLMSIGEIGGQKNAEWLLQTLRKGSKALVKPWAASALGTLAFRMRGEGQSRDELATIGAALLREFKAVRNDETRAALAVSLGMTGYAEAADELRAALAEEKHRDELAGYLCVGLSMMGSREAIADIREVVRSSARRPGLLRQAAIALGKLGDKEASEQLIAMLGDRSPTLAKLSSVSVALGLIGDRRSIDPLIELLQDESQPEISRSFAAVGLGGVADDAPLPWGSDLAIGVNYRAAVGTLTDGIAGVLDIL